jgi:hypothetical protein
VAAVLMRLCLYFGLGIGCTWLRSRVTHAPTCRAPGQECAGQLAAARTTERPKAHKHASAQPASEIAHWRIRGKYTITLTRNAVSSSGFGSGCLTRIQPGVSKMHRWHSFGLYYYWSTRTPRARWHWSTICITNISLNEIRSSSLPHHIICSSGVHTCQNTTINSPRLMIRLILSLPMHWHGKPFFCQNSLK